MDIVSTRQGLSSWPASAVGVRPAADVRASAERMVAERVVEGEVLGRARAGDGARDDAGPFAAGFPGQHGLAAYLANTVDSAARAAPAPRIDCYA
jgi:hypothetical protein